MFTKLLVPLDRSAVAEQALGRAAAIARAARAEVDLALVHQSFVLDGVDVHFEADNRREETDYLDATARDFATGAVVPVRRSLLDGSVPEAICRRAEEIGADLIVMTSHGRTGLRRVWAGSVADAVMRRASIPVLMLRPIENTTTARRAAHHLFKRILVLVEDSAPALEILAPAAQLARCGGGQVTLLRVIRPIPNVALEPPLLMSPPLTVDETATQTLLLETVRDLTGLANTLARQEGVEVDGQVIVGHDVVRAARDFIKAHHPDLIAMITHGRGASRVIVASIADKLIRSGGLPVLLLNPQDRPESADDDMPADEAHFMTVI